MEVENALLDCGGAEASLAKQSGRHRLLSATEGTTLNAVGRTSAQQPLCSSQRWSEEQKLDLLEESLRSGDCRMRWWCCGGDQEVITSRTKRAFKIEGEGGFNLHSEAVIVKHSSARARYTSAVCCCLLLSAVACCRTFTFTWLWAWLVAAEQS